MKKVLKPTTHRIEVRRDRDFVGSQVPLESLRLAVTSLVSAAKLPFGDYKLIVNRIAREHYSDAPKGSGMRLTSTSYVGSYKLAIRPSVAVAVTYSCDFIVCVPAVSIGLKETIRSTCLMLDDSNWEVAVSNNVATKSKEGKAILGQPLSVASPVQSTMMKYMPISTQPRPPMLEVARPTASPVEVAGFDLASTKLAISAGIARLRSQTQANQAELSQEKARLLLARTSIRERLQEIAREVRLYETLSGDLARMAAENAELKPIKI